MYKPNHPEIRLPNDFLFGVATAAYQIEGAVDKDGRGPSIWDEFAHTDGNVVNNDNGDIACDHYHRWESDLDIVKNIDVGAYRFSFSWSRVFASGRGAVNDKGVSFYEQLIDGCLERGLKPFATLYHWDLPLALYNEGGWTNRDTAYAFAEYAETITQLFGDRLASISTFNEPWCSAMLGHLYGVHAPGFKDLSMALKVVHNQHLAHGLAVERIKSVQKELETGIVLNLQSIYPKTDSDKPASKRHDIFHNRAYLDPLFKGYYPDELITHLGQHLPRDWENDLPTIHQPLDFWGLNYYTPVRIVDNSNSTADYPATAVASLSPSCPVTDIGWEIDASTFYDVIHYAYQNYDLPKCYITENGACFNDEPVDGTVEDYKRIDYLEQHINVISQVVEENIPVVGFFAWSLMDNFEWAEGYTMRFGLVHVDYSTQTRTIKNSGHWYANLAHKHRHVNT